MSTRKYASGYERLKKRKKKLIESQKGLMDKFVISNKQNITQNLDENLTNEQEIHQKELEDDEMIQLQNVTVTFVERSFSKLKLIKPYLKSTMSQERLSGLTILSIENEMLEDFEYKILISQFASQNARKIFFK